MTTADWGLLTGAVVTFLGAAGAWLRANAAHKRIDRLRKPPGT
jgi:hypothetical protein